MVPTTPPFATPELDVVGEDAPALVPDQADLVHGSLAPALDVLAAQVEGTLSAHRLVVYSDYLVATIESPSLPGELDRWVIYLPDQVTGPHPQSNPGDIAAELFDPRGLDLSVLASLPAQAVAELGVEPETTYLIVERSSAHGGQLTATVYASDERRSGYVRFATDGSILDAHGE